MAFPQIEATNTGYNNTTSTTDHTVNLPASIASGELLVIFFATYATPTINDVTDWTRLGTTDTYGTYIQQAIFYKTATGSEGSTVQVTTDSGTASSHVTCRISGWSGTPEKGTMYTSTSTTPNPPSLTPSWGADDTLWIANVANRNDSFSAYPSNYTVDQVNCGNTATSNAAFNAIATRELNATSEDPGTFTLSTNRYALAQTIAIQPSTGGSYNQSSFRGRNDDGSETAATWKAAINTNFSQTIDTNFRIRFLVQEEDDVEDLDVQFQLQYNINSGGWNDVNGSSSVVRSFASSNFTEGDDTTQQLGSGTYITNNDCMDESNGLVGGSNLDFTTTANQEVEAEFCIQIRGTDVANNDTIQLRLVKEADIDFDTYTNTPTITVIGISYNQASFRGRNDDGSETAATWKASVNINWAQNPDENFRIRFLVQEDSDLADNDVQFQLQYNLASGGWNDVNASSSVVRSFASTYLTDGEDTTQQLGSGTYITNNNCVDEVNGLVGGSNLDFTTTANQEVEAEFCIQIRSADIVSGQTVQLRLIKESDVTFDTYTNTPTISPILPLEDYDVAVTATGPDEYWMFQNDYVDEISGNDFDDSTTGSPTFVTDPVLCRGDTYSLQINSAPENCSAPNNDDMNIGIHTRRYIGGWIQVDSYQKNLVVVYEEGAGINNIAFLLGFGNILLAQLMDSKTDDPGTDYVQCYSDMTIEPNRPYHIMLKFEGASYDAEVKLFIDGVEQSRTEGNPWTPNGFDEHLGDICIGKTAETGNDLETLNIGGTIIEFYAPIACYYAHWVNYDAQSVSATTIREELFEKGMLTDEEIDSDTQSNMQTDLDTYADTTRPNWPCAIKINRVSGGGNLELTADNITFNENCSVEIWWDGVGGEILTYLLTNGATLDSDKIATPRGGTVNIVPVVDVQVTVQDAEDLTDIQSALVVLYAASGGDLPYQDSVSIVRSGSTATVTHTGHGLITGNKVLIAGATQNEYNGIYTITVVDINTYTYTVSGTPETPATGTIVSTSVILSDTTDSNGEVSTTHRYTSAQPFTGKARKSTTTPLYKEASISGTILSVGYNSTTLMVLDE